MDRLEAMSLIGSGNRGLDEWNTLPEDLRKGTDLRRLDFSGKSLYKARLDGVDLSNSNLSGADLHKANLTFSNLHESVLADCNLSGAVLYGSVLSRAYLRRCNLRSADARNTDLNNASLVEAFCQQADFSFANLRAARVDGADFSGAKFYGTALIDLDISSSLGLSAVSHAGPSSIGFDTLVKSKGKIPAAFLRGCGLSENLITYLPSLTGIAIDFYSAFISYSHADRPFARRLHDQLQANGVRCWLDEKQILPGDDIYSEVDKGLKEYDKVLLVASKDSLNSWWVERELDNAFEREMKLQKERGESVLSIIPLNLDGHLFDWDHPHAKSLRKRLAADFTKDGESDYDAKFEQQLELVIKALRADKGRKEPPPEPL